MYELRGISALDLEQVHSKKSITVSRSFGETVTDLQSLKEHYQTIFLEQLKNFDYKEVCVARYVFLLIQTSLKKVNHNIVTLE